MYNNPKQEVNSLRKLVDLVYDADKDFKVFNFDEDMLEDMLELGEKYEMDTLDEKVKYIKLNRLYRYSCQKKIFKLLENLSVSFNANTFDEFVEQTLFDETKKMKSRIFSEVFYILKSIEKSKAILVSEDIIFKIKENADDSEINIDWRIDLDKQLNNRTLVILKWLYIKYLRK